MLRQEWLRGAGRDDRIRAALRRRTDFSGADRQAGSLLAVGRTGRGGDGSYRARALARCDRDRACVGKYTGQARAGLCRRSPDHTLSCNRQADLRRTRDEPPDVGERGDAGKHEDAARSRRAGHRSGERCAGLRRSRRGPCVGTRGDRHCRACRTDTERGSFDRRQSRRHGWPDARADRPGSLHHQPFFRQARLCRRRGTRAARRGSHVDQRAGHSADAG